MGTFFTNIHVRASSVRVVDGHLKQVIKGEAYRSKLNGGWISIFDEATESQDITELQRLAEELSSRLQTVAIAFLVHDSDTAVYLIYEKGQLVDRFQSSPPDAEEEDASAPNLSGNAEIILKFMRQGVSIEAVEQVLQQGSGGDSRPYLREEERIGEIARLFGIDGERACVGFNYISEDDAIPFVKNLRKIAAPRPKSLINPIFKGDTKKVRQYLLRGADPNEPMALGFALSLGQSEIIHLLLDAGAKLDAVPNSVVYAGVWGDPGVIKRVLELTRGGPSERNIALLEACGTGRVETIKFLLSEGADPNMRNANGVTPLMSAASWRHVNAVQLLLEAGADPALKDDLGRTAADFAGLPLFSSNAHGVNGSDANVPRIISLLAEKA